MKEQRFRKVVKYKIDTETVSMNLASSFVLLGMLAAFTFMGSLIGMGICGVLLILIKFSRVLDSRKVYWVKEKEK